MILNLTTLSTKMLEEMLQRQITRATLMSINGREDSAKTAKRKAVTIHTELQCRLN